MAPTLTLLRSVQLSILSLNLTTLAVLKSSSISKTLISTHNCVACPRAFIKFANAITLSFLGLLSFRSAESISASDA